MILALNSDGPPAVTRQLPFLKMNGLGNDFVVIDKRATPVDLTPEMIRAIADRDTGIGCDQFITIERSPLGVDAFMRINNADGSEVNACGNATRCIASLLMAEAASSAATIETRAGLLIARTTDDALISVDMGMPKFDWQDIPLAEEFRDTRAIELQIGPIDAPVLHSPSVVNVGNPHAIFWVDGDVEDYDLARSGPVLEHHPIFPEGANISLAHVTAPDALTLKVWERGVGLTLACGTAACAAAVCAARTRRTGRTVTVTLPGGPLRIEWRQSDDHILMTGPVETEFSGTIDLDTLTWQKAA